MNTGGVFRRLAPLVLLIVALTTACDDPNFTESQLRLSVTNEGTGTLYWVKAPAATGASGPIDGPHQPIPPGSTSVIRAGGVEVDPDAGGCFRDEQLWLVTSKSDTRYDVEDPRHPMM
jgi:hypothetical protein